MLLGSLSLPASFLRLNGKKRQDEIETAPFALRQIAARVCGLELMAMLCATRGQTRAGEYRVGKENPAAGAPLRGAMDHRRDGPRTAAERRGRSGPRISMSRFMPPRQRIGMAAGEDGRGWPRARA